MGGRKTARFAAVCVVFLGLLSSIGCYESEYTIGTVQTAVVDRGYVGNFTFTEENKAVSLVIRNFDDKQYYVEWGSDGRERVRSAGFTGEIKGVRFVNLREMRSGVGALDNNYLIMRVSLSDDRSTLTIRNLDENFFKARNIGSAAALRAVIESNLDNDAMYDKDVVVAKRVATTRPA
jgi:hypothetical protein